MRVGPRAPGMPEIWLLGSAVGSAQIAAQRGLPFSFAHFFRSTEQGSAIADPYRKHFRPSRWLSEPRVHVAVRVMCAGTRDDAEWHAASLRVGRVQMARRRGGTGIVPPEEAAKHVFTPEELHFLEHSGLRATVGDPAAVSAELRGIAERYACDELGIVTICYDFAARRRSHELVAGALRD
jgi:luciferase family oxidoreductase group 1